MLFERIYTNKSYQNVAYLIGDGKGGDIAVVDPGHGPELVLSRVEALGRRLRYVLLTHGHSDHLGRPDEIAKIRKATGAVLAAYKTVKALEPGDVPLDDGDVLKIGQLRVKVIHTPGHSHDSVCFLVNEQKLLTGDTLFVGRATKGRSPTHLYHSLHNILMKLPDDIEVWPGHDVADKPSSTIGQERESNYVLQMSLEDFCRREWNRKLTRWVIPDT